MHCGRYCAVNHIKKENMVAVLCDKTWQRSGGQRWPNTTTLKPLCHVGADMEHSHGDIKPRWCPELKEYVSRNSIRLFPAWSCARGFEDWKKHINAVHFFPPQFCTNGYRGSYFMKCVEIEKFLAHLSPQVRELPSHPRNFPPSFFNVHRPLAIVWAMRNVKKKLQVPFGPSRSWR